MSSICNYAEVLFGLITLEGHLFLDKLRSYIIVLKLCPRFSGRNGP